MAKMMELEAVVGGNVTPALEKIVMTVSASATKIDQQVPDKNVPPIP
jgi:hypothetical protein